MNRYMFDDLRHKTSPSDPGVCVNGCLISITMNNYNNLCPNRVEELHQAWLALMDQSNKTEKLP